MRTPFSLSIVIPVYNESRRLEKTFTELNEFLSADLFSSVEVIFVNDGSDDGTKKQLEEKSQKMKWRVISYGSNRGKGYALRQGMKVSKGDYCLIADADMSTPLGEFFKFIPYMEKGLPAIIGTRKARGARVVVHQSWHREGMGRVYTFLANIVTGANVSDFTCGFKCFSKDIAHKLAAMGQIDRWSYDAEFLFLLRKVLRLPIVEVPVVWYNDPHTSVRLLLDTLTSFKDLLLIRFKKRK